MEDWFNLNSNDDFNPEDHGIEMDEIAQMYAMADMKEEHKAWAKEQAEKFYKDFETLDIPDAVSAVITLIKSKSVTLDQTNTMLDNMIQVFQEYEEYERCHVCLEIKKGINARI
jgi:hypothetical protein